MPKKKVFPYKGIDYDSKEEVEFQMWVEIAIKYKLLSYAEYKPPKIDLSVAHSRDIAVSGKIKTISLIQAKHYEPDWLIHVTEKFKKWFPNILVYHTDNRAYIDVKGTAPFGMNQNSSFYTFPIKQAWIYQLYDVYINKVICRPKKKKGGIITNLGFFLRTFVPEELIYMKNRKVLTRCKDWDNSNTRTIDELERFYN